MAEHGRASISGGEWDILNALWGGGPSTARGVAERLSEERGWAYSTVKTMLDRANVLLKAGGGTISWKSIEAAVSSNQGWPAIGGKAEWGFVKLGHTDPTQSNSGLQALLLMTMEYYGKTTGLTVADVLDPGYQAFIAGPEKGVAKFEASTGTFMTDMVRFGPSKYDIAAVYEGIAISQIENAQGRWGNLRVYYPATTIWSDHPAAVLLAARVRKE